MAYIGQGIKNGTFAKLDTSGNTYNGSNVTFALGTQVGSPVQLLVSHDGVIQNPGTDYTLASNGTQITFTTAPASGASIFIMEISGAVGGPMNRDLNGEELILDVDGDTSITADTDDQIDVKIAGADDFKFTANTFTANSGSGIVVPDGGLTLGSTAISSTAAEINLIDGNTARGTTAIADGDGVLINDDGTMRMTTVQTLATYIGGGTLVKVGDVRSNSAASSHQLNGIFSDTYDKYFFSLSTFPSTGNSEIHFQFVDGSNNAVTSSYRGVSFGKNQAGTDKTHNSQGTSEIKINNGHGNGRALQAQGYIIGPTSGIDNNKQVHFQAGQFDNANDFEYQIGGFFHTSATDYTGMLIKTNSGNLTAISLQVYGIVDTKHYNGS